MLMMLSDRYDRIRMTVSCMTDTQCWFSVQHGVGEPKPNIFICIGGATCCFID